MIKRAYIIQRGSALAERAVKLNDRQQQGKQLFQKKEEWEALLEADWNDWFQDARNYINHVYPGVIASRIFDVAIVDGNVFVEENDAHFTNQPIVNN
ncbi:hypothetical protein VPHD479_0045 [Vibrio phage D479]